MKSSFPSIRRIVAEAAACVTLLLFPAIGSAAPMTWTGLTSTDWLEPGNWTPLQPPTAGDTLTIDGPMTTEASAPFTTNDTITATGGADVAFTRLGVGDTAPGQLLISGAALVHDPAWQFVLDVGLHSGVTGEVRVTGTGVSGWPNSRLECKTLTLGGFAGAAAGQPGGAGVLVIEQYGQVAADALQLGVPAANGGVGYIEVTSGGLLGLSSDLTVDGFGGATSTLNVSGADSMCGVNNLVVGGEGKGAVMIAHGATLQASHLELGTEPTGDGGMVISGADARLVGPSGITVGLGGSGRVFVREDAVLAMDYIDAGVNQGGSGDVRVTGNGVTGWPNSRLELTTLTLGGANGAGAGQPGGVGTLIIEQSGMGDINTLQFGVPAANAGSGLVEVTSGGSLGVASDLAVDGFGGATSSLRVAGTGSQCIVNGGSGNLSAGRDGRGQLTLENGGELRVASLTLGEHAAGDGAMVFSGPAFSLAVSQGTVVGLSGKGTLTVTNDATLTLGAMDVGVNTEGTGEVRVTGNGAAGSPNARLELATLTLGGANGAGAGQPGGVGTLIIEQSGVGAIDTLQFGAPAANAGSGLVDLITGGSLAVNASGVSVDGFGGATSSLRIAGTGSQCIVNGGSRNLSAGRDGRGQLTLENGGELQVAFLTLGDHAAGDGAMVFSGPASSLTVSQGTVVGLSGKGTLTVTNDATLTLGAMDVGVNAGGTGDVRVTGNGVAGWPNSRLELTTLTLGGANGAGAEQPGGVGTLIIEQSGMGAIDTLQFGAPAANAGSGHVDLITGGSLAVNASGVSVDGFGGETSSVRVLGAGARLAVNTGTLAVGQTGRGTLTLDSGGLLECPNLTVGSEASGIGQVEIRGASITNVTHDVTVATGGTLVLEDGTLRADTLTLASVGGFDFKSGHLHLGSLLNGSATNQGGTLHPGNSTALLNVNGDYTQAAAGTLEIEIDAQSLIAPKCDTLAVSGTQSAGGTLDVVFLLGSSPPNNGQSFDILDWGSLVGTFNTVSVPAISGYSWDMAALYTTGAITFRANVPEPAMGLLAAFGLAGIIGARGRRRLRISS